MSIGVVLCAAGKGKRMQLGHNKQFLELAGKPLLIHTLEVFINQPLIDDLILVIGQDEEEQVASLLNKYELAHKVTQLVYGGKERQDSVYNGLLALNELAEAPEYVLIHDAARPFVQPEEIDRLIEAVRRYSAATLAVPVTDTIKRANDKEFVVETLNRSELWAIQTPQGFTLSSILRAHELAREEGYLGTDDASLIERLGQEVKLVLGSYDNIKLTTPEDIALAEFLLQRRKTRT